MKMKINNILSANQQLPVSEKATGTNAFQIIKNVYPLPFKKNNPIFLILTACQILASSKIKENHNRKKPKKMKETAKQSTKGDQGSPSEKKNTKC